MTAGEWPLLPERSPTPGSIADRLQQEESKGWGVVTRDTPSAGYGAVMVLGRVVTSGLGIPPSPYSARTVGAARQRPIGRRAGWQPRP